MFRLPAGRAVQAAVLLAAILPAGRVGAEPPASGTDGQRAAGERAARVSDEDKAIARREFLRGKELHAAHKYRAAAAAYLAAYDRFPSPAFLYNVAQVYRLAGDRQAALDHYRKYLELEPNGEASADAREFVSALEAELASESPDQGAPPAPARAGRTDGGSAPIEPSYAHAPVDHGPIGGSPGRGKKIAGTAIGAVGVVAVGVAVGFGLRARSAADDISDYRGPWTPDQESTYDDGKSAERTMIISGAIGGACLAAGAVLFYLGHRDARRAVERRRTQLLGESARRSPIRIGASADSDAAFVLLRGVF